MADQLTEARLRELAGADSFSRGRSYFRHGDVRSLVRRGDVVEAAVQGGAPRPYQVRIHLPEQGPISATCTCPYDWGGWCKHRVAAALALLETPASVVEKAPLAEIIAALSREELEGALLSMLEADVNLGERFELALARHRREAELAALREKSVAPGGATDPALIAQRIQTVLRGIEIDKRYFGYDDDSDYYDRYAYEDEYEDMEMHFAVAIMPVFDEVFDLWSHVIARLEEGESADARVAAEAIVSTVLENESPLHLHADALAELLGSLDREVTPVLLGLDLDPDERNAWEAAFQTWSQHAARFFVRDAFALARALLAWRPQHASEIAAQVRAAPESVPRELMYALLPYLTEQNEHEAVLALLRKTGSRTAYLDKLLELGRRDEAIAYAESETWWPGELTAVIRQLEQRGERMAALQIAVREIERGQDTSDADPRLIAWARDAAAALGETEVALSMALRLFESSPTLHGYIELQKLAGDQWPQTRENVLAKLRSTYRGQGNPQVIDIFLHEKLHDDVLALLSPYTSPDMLVRLVDALSATHPDWAVAQALREAMAIIGAGASARYDTAVEWLRRVRDIFRGAGHPEHWDALVDELRTSEHGRKRKLMGLLDRIA